MPDHTPTSAGKLVDVLGEDDATIVLERGSVFDLTEFTLPNLGRGGALLSGGEHDDDPSATLLYNDRTDGAVLECYGDFHWEGVELSGPEHDRIPDEGPETVGLFLHGNNAIVKRASFHGWPVAGVQIGSAGSSGSQTEATISNSSFHHCLMDGYGYGVELVNGDLEIDGCELDYNRHSITSDGRPTASYDAHHSWLGRHTTGHVIDVHGRTRGQGPPVAGAQTTIHDCAIEATHDLDGRPQEAVKIRGVPAKGCAIYSNRFAHSEPPKEPGGDGQAIYQTAVNEWTRLVEFDNQYDAT